MQRGLIQRFLSGLLVLFMVGTLFFVNGIAAQATPDRYQLSNYEKNLLQNLAFKGWQGYKVPEADLIAETQIRVAGWVNEIDELMKIDGIMGPQTRKAIRNFNIYYGTGSTDRITYDTAQMLYWLESNDGSTAHFSWSEFGCRGYGCTWDVWYGTTPKPLSHQWTQLSTYQVKENVRRLMWRLEALRAKAGNRPVIVTSGFRYYTYNTSIGGAKNSRHIYGQAADISIKGVSNSRVSELARQSSFGGIGMYKNFVHVDTRDYVVRWD